MRHRLTIDGQRQRERRGGQLLPTERRVRKENDKCRQSVEVVFKVLSPHIPLADPYAEEIQDLLRLTNLRINFTKLHTLGDNILDRRPEITEKYYYAVYNIVVRGSCSCYGHASQCKPIEGDYVTFVESHRADMVYGRCECTHHTKGLNCEQCQDFYNDLPWQPAIDRERNACKMCNCNLHATKCHFDRAVYEASGYVSGGVCDDCEHNTMGKNCEMCKPFFYRDPHRDISDPYVCLRKATGICDGETVPERNLVSGRCSCKAHVIGENCGQCENGYWNLKQDNPEGCQQCTCHLLGTVGNEGCNKQTGECTCKRLVTGENCNRCLVSDLIPCHFSASLAYSSCFLFETQDEHWGLDDSVDGCKACDCDLGGAYDNNCDVLNGQCRCRRHFTGRRCDQPESGYFCANLDFYTYEAENAKIEGPAETELREPYSDGRQHWTGSGMVRVREKSTLDFVVDNINVAMNFHVVLRFESHLAAAWQNVKINIIRPDSPSASGPCHNTIPKDDLLQVMLLPGERYFESVEEVCLEPDVQYHVQVVFDEYQRGFPDRSVSLLIDSLVLMPVVSKLPLFAGKDDWSHYKLREFEHYQCERSVLQLTPLEEVPEPCRRYLCPVAASIIDRGVECNCDPTGSLSGICNVLGGQCQCKQNVVGHQCDRCSPGTYGFGPQGCTACDCNNVGSLHNFCHLNTGQCVCRDGVYGRQCDQCQPGYWGFPNCRPCICNGHADICEQSTGVCIDCRDLSTGDQCDRCQNGYYGDPRLGSNLPCRPCSCPGGPGSGFQHADTCYLDPSTQNVFCNCRHGYEGERCDRCAMNYWGNPTEVGGTCAQCDCSGNIDFTEPASCDQKTGKCLKCLYNTEGFSCENCLPGFFGEAKTQSCKMCVCNVLGTNISVGPCDRFTGQCPCLPNVTGLECDTCIPNHWKIASGTGCFDCECDPQGVVSLANGVPFLQCNEFDGQCRCKEGRGGRTCGECENYYWGDPRVECRKCECNPIGSATLQCHRNNGTCICMPGSGGIHCDRCDRGHTGTWPYCEPCGECFQNWDQILFKLKEETQCLIDDASKVEDTGVSSVYDGDFKLLEKQLSDMRASIGRANLSQADIGSLQQNATRFESRLEMVRSKLNTIDHGISEIDANIDSSEEHLNSLIKQTAELKSSISELEQNATRLREADAEGAYNVTKEAAEVSLQAQQKAEATEQLIAQAEAASQQTTKLLNANAQDFDEQFRQNQAVLDELEEKARSLETKIPDLNMMVCGAKGDPCDDLCGGAGCGKCGGPSCQEGAVTKSDQALTFSNEASEKLKAKQQKAHEMIEKLSEAQSHSEVALLDARQAYETAVRVAQGANESRSALTALLERTERFKQAKGASPDEIRALAQEVLDTTISLNPEQIQELARNISETLSKLTNINAILAETHSNLAHAQKLKDRADQAKYDQPSRSFVVLL
ncbi:unnamed protein product [Soboliphyme baturini]|uniref:Laminin subunit beta-1 n=1 Tax=Soboliphyme baturini TaxID=241478 RepID=A0A183IQR1_9BILA|nr:unnamed protein product [Soboliphyme baturini]